MELRDMLKRNVEEAKRKEQERQERRRRQQEQARREIALFKEKIGYDQLVQEIDEERKRKLGTQ